MPTTPRLHAAGTDKLYPAFGIPSANPAPNGVTFHYAFNCAVIPAPEGATHGIAYMRGNGDIVSLLRVTHKGVAIAALPAGESK